MLCVATEIRPSAIHGLGVFLLVPVKKGEVIWRFDPRIDIAYTHTDLDNLPKIAQDFVRKYAFYHGAGQLWILPGDNDRYTNHSDDPTTYTESDDPRDNVIAPRDLEAGTELTADYGVINTLIN